MFYVCVVCMVSVKGRPLIRLTGARCQLWELMISPRISTAKMKGCLLLVCSECNQLLTTMLEFRRTMHIGAKNLLFLYKNLRCRKDQISSLVQELEPCHELPTLIGAQSDEWLPVVNEEVVQSETWTDDAKAAAPVSTTTEPVKLPSAMPSQIINHKAVHVSEYNVDYAVLIPINEDTNLQCKEDVMDSSDLSETSQIEQATPIPEDVKDETFKAEFSSVSNSSIVKKLKKIKLNRQLFDGIRATLKSPSLIEEFDIKYDPESESDLGCLDLSGPDLAREWALKVALGSERKSVLESERKSVLESELKSGLELERKSVLEPERKSGLESKRKSVLEPERNSGLESERKSGLESKRKSVLESKRKSVLESKRKSVLESKRKSVLESKRKSVLESKRKSVLESKRKSVLESKRKSVLESKRKSVLQPERKSGLESECKSALESERKSELESAHESDPNSESTLSCISDYEDPEHFPNIIFAQTFNRLANKSPQMKEKYLEQGKKSEEQIHCHLVTNPPSEWPCNGEQCQLRSLYEDEDSNSASDRPRDTPLVRSNTRAVDPGRPRCKLCNRSFAKISMLWQHFEREHMDASLKCNVCRKEFRNETELAFHKVKHQFKKTVEFKFEAPSRHGCLECALRCRSARHLRVHLATRRHATKMLWRFQCDICKRKCPDKKGMAEHIQREHLAKEEVKCSMCSASFRSARTLRRHVAMHIVESQTLKNKPADKQTHGQARKRTRKRQTKGNENTDSDILRNADGTQTEIQTNGQARKRPYNISRKTSTAGRRPPPKSATVTDPALPGRQSTLTTTTPRKTTAYRQRNTHAYTYVNEQHDIEIQTNGQTRKRPRKIAHKKVNAFTNRQGNKDTYIQDEMTEIQTNRQTSKKPRKVTHRLTDTYINEQDDMDIQTNKQTRKITNKKVNTHINTHADMYTKEQDDTEVQANGQTRKKPSKAIRNSQVNTLINKQETLPTATYVYGQENTPKAQARKNSDKVTHPNGGKTHTDIQETIPKVADNITHTHTNGRVRKRRKKRAYVTSKRARMLTKAAADRASSAAANTRLFDMLSSFIL